MPAEKAPETNTFLRGTRALSKFPPSSAGLCAGSNPKSPALKHERHNFIPLHTP